MMSKKNTKGSQRKNKYPLPNRTVLYSRKKNLQPIPEVGKRYHCFDDGKITFSRHFIIQVDEIIGHMEFKKKYPVLFEQYKENLIRCYWLYTSSDKFVITYNGENNEIGAYTRTKRGGWFGAGEFWNSATLDVTGKLWENLVANIDDFDYTEEEKKQLIEENTI
jgi:hypothetical protein